MKFEVSTGYLDPVVLDPYEHVSVVLPDGRQVTVYSDRVYVATAEDQQRHKSGRVVWEARSPRRWPYGKTCQVPEPGDGKPPTG